MKLRKHPIVLSVERFGIHPVAKALSVDRTSVYKYFNYALVDRDSKVPAEWAIPLARLSGIHPFYWRPDLYDKSGLGSIDDFPWGLDFAPVFDEKNEA